MSEIITLEKKICIDSKYLDKNLRRNILNELKESIIGECSQETGYFLRIVRLKKIKDNYISPTCENIFIVEFEAEVLNPLIGKQFTGDVCLIVSSGIFVNIQQKLKVLIPATLLKEHKFDKAENCFTNKTSKKKILKADILTIVITNSKYSKKTFVCFGTLAS